MDVVSLRLFLAVAKLGSVTKAAQQLGFSAASASARISKLEEELNFRLFNRTTRAVSLTTDGVSFLPYAQQSLETLEAGIGAISGEAEKASGVLKMTMPGSFGRMHIIPFLSEFKEAYPLINLDLRLSDEVLDAVEGAYDLIIRNAPLMDSSMIARKLAPDSRILVASPQYLEKYGTPLSPDDLAEHECITFANQKWVFSSGKFISPNRSVVINDGEAMRMLLESGCGIGVKSMWNIYQSLESGHLVEVLPDHPLRTESAIWALYLGGRVLAPKVRLMIDFLLSKFHPNPYWDKS
ncbi:MAG: LysR family transcriptional regulator [Pseudomonadota bacterium]|jgi:DNA-binding transcriptional LysR family regulator|nr:LysR family transcriptional regulator [Pseudomonadota bacterium]